MQRSNKKLVAYLVSLLLLLSLFSGFQNAYANGAVAPLVETQWLADNLKKPDIRILHIGEVENNFNAKHIPGSVFLNVGDLMGLLGNGSMAPDKAKFEGTMSRLGIDNDAHVVIVGSATGTPFPVTAFWLMKSQGHNKVSLLNGGVTKWVNENRQMTGDPASIKTSKYTAKPDLSVFADAKYVLANIKNPKVAILDVRGADEYLGANAIGMNKRTGHIPGAVNLDSMPTSNNNDGTFKSVKDLQAAYAAKGVTKDKEVITYCQGGVRAANTYFALKHILGYPNVRNYVGSWGEWGDQLDPAKYPAEK
ncbi:MAG: sulfurtransferase [Thermodesulfovibrionia bacterium]|nr:sulfurtransferase [Thermodesulfovibrionia bacterium]